MYNHNKNNKPKKKQILWSTFIARVHLCWCAFFTCCVLCALSELDLATLLSNVKDSKAQEAGVVRRWKEEWKLHALPVNGYKNNWKSWLEAAKKFSINRESCSLAHRLFSPCLCGSLLQSQELNSLSPAMVNVNTFYAACFNPHFYRHHWYLPFWFM